MYISTIQLVLLQLVESGLLTSITAYSSACLVASWRAANAGNFLVSPQ